MRAITCHGAGLLGVLLAVSTSFGYTWVDPIFHRPYPPAPDTYGPGFYSVNGCGAVYGPNYYLQPPCAPFNGFVPVPNAYQLMPQQCRPPIPRTPNPGVPPGMMPAMPGTPGTPATPGRDYPNAGANQQQMVYPTHPFVRSPRDFFMWNEALEDQRGRDVRPLYVP